MRSGVDSVILIDTHVILWLTLEPEKLSTRAATMIRETRLKGDAVAISAMSLYEISLIARRGRVEIGIQIGSFLTEIQEGFVVKPITAEIADVATSFPKAYPRDPMDRLVGATAIVEGLPLITTDDRIRRSGLVQTIW